MLVGAPAAVGASLQGGRTSRFATPRTAYRARHDLVMGRWTSIGANPQLSIDGIGARLAGKPAPRVSP